MIISFGHTTPALLAGRKTVTRRDWSDRQFEIIHRYWQQGLALDAWSASPRNRAADPKAVGKIVMTHEPVRESSDVAPESDYEAEGFVYLTEAGLLVFGLTPEALWRKWHDEPRVMTTVRFSFEPLTIGAS